MQNIAALLAAFATALIIAFVAFPIWSKDGDLSRRRRAVILEAPIRETDRERAERRHRENIAARLRVISERERGRRQRSLPLRMEQAGLHISTRRLHLISAASAFLVGIIVYLAVSAVPAVIAVCVSFFLGEKIILGQLAARRQARFAEELPNVLDAIARATKAGISLNSALEAAIINSKEPLKAEFERMLSAQALGAPLYEAAGRMAQRVPLEETRFLALALELNDKNGGRIAENLDNLAKTLRGRAQVKGKIQAQSSKDKWSARIVACFPFGIMAINYSSSPETTSILWKNPTGLIILVACVVWMAIGVAVLFKLTQVKV